MKSHFTCFLLVFAFLTTGCSPIQFAPSIDGVSPNWGYNGESTSVSVMGGPFLAGMGVTGGDVERYDRDFVLSLEGVETHTLEVVKQVGSGQIDGVVPPGLNPGWYGLRLETPGGESAFLDDAFEVTSSRADKVAISVSRNVVPVSGLAIVRMSLLDPDGALVPEPVEVEVRMIPTETDGSGFTVTAGDLDGVTQGEAAGIIGGYLGESGEGFVGISSDQPDDIWVEVVATIRDRVSVSARDLVRFEAGDVAKVNVQLPAFDGPVTAGSVFDVTLQLVDDAGNFVLDQPATVALTEECLGGTLNETVTFVGAAIVSVMPTRACERNRVKAFGVVEGLGIEGASDEFEVLSGGLTKLIAMASPERVQAGIEDVMVFVQGADTWDNPSKEPLGDLTLSDEVGELNEANGNGYYSCDSVVSGTAQCMARLFVASAARPITVEGVEGVFGHTAAIQVAAGPGETVDVSLIDDVAVAGVATEIFVQVIDAFGNPLIIGSDDREDLAFSDNDGPITCSPSGADIYDRIYSFDCVFTVAGAGRQLNVSSPGLGVLGHADPIVVVANTLANAEITVDDGDIAGGLYVGDALTVAIEGFDLYGNRVDGTYVLDLDSVGGGVTPATVTLEDGVALSTVSFEVALGGESVWVFFDDTVLGGSRAFDVWPGSAVDVEIWTDEPWAFVGEPFPVNVALVDEFGNITSGSEADWTVTSRGGLGHAVSGVLVDVTQAMITFTSAGLGDTLDVEVGSFSGTVSGIDVARRCVPAGGGSMEAAGHADGRVCLGEAGETEIELSWGMVDFLHASVAVDGESFYRGEGTETGLGLSTEGRTRIEAMLIDESACGALQSIDVYAGLEGGAVGPVSLMAASGVLIAEGSETTGTTGVYASASQCSGDPAADAELYIRQDKGAIEAVGDTALLPSGAGIVLHLNEDGEGEVVWSMEDEAVGAASTLLVGTLNGAALGAVQVDVNGDSGPPQVMSVSPIGAYVGSIPEIEVTFSEAMLPLGDVADYLHIYSEEGEAIPVVDFDGDMDTLRLAFDPPLNTSITTWEIVLFDTFRDAAGNRIDGDLDGVAGGDWAQSVGPLGTSAPEVTNCALTTGWFSPDGDDGVGLETDYVWVSLEASGPSEWWQLSVFDSSGAHISRSFHPRVRPFDGSLLFEGKDSYGRSLPSGRYLLSVSALDEDWNTGAPCSASVMVSHNLNAD